MLKQAISESSMNIFRLLYGVYQKTVLSEMPFIIYELISISNSFAEIFCQNIVKKNRNFVS